MKIVSNALSSKLDIEALSRVFSFEMMF